MLEKVLRGFPLLKSDEDAKIWCKVRWPTIQLLGKADHAQGKMHSLECLLRKAIKDMNELGVTEIGTMWSLKMLLTFRTLQVQMTNHMPREVLEASLHSVAHKLVEYPALTDWKGLQQLVDGDEASSMLVSLYTGLFRHKQFCKSADLLDLMTKIEVTVLSITPNTTPWTY